MSIKINLIPVDKRVPQWHYGRLLLLPVFVMMLILGAFFGYGEYQYWDLGQQLSQVRAKAESLSRAEQQMKQSQTQQAALQARQKILVQLNGERKSIYANIAQVGTFIPRRVWLTEIGSSAPGVWQMKGNATTFPELGTFLGKMETDKVFIDPLLTRASQNEKEATIMFELTVRLRGL